jgi:hypothetical protein
VPHELVMAIEHAHRILDWHDNMVSEEIPPQWMWPFEDELKIWFQQVEEKRDERNGNHGDKDTTVPMMSNDMAKGRRG